MRYLLLLFIIAPSVVFALSENKLQEAYNLLDHNSFSKPLFYKGKQNKKIHYQKWGKSLGAKGSILISLGNGQSANEFTEIALDLEKVGYSPIYITSHRGQGFSDRLLDNPHKSHIDDFNYYGDDLSIFVKLIREEIGQESKLFNLSHSMGGAITLNFLLRYKNPFSKIAFSSPMFKIKGNELSIILQTIAACYSPFGPKCLDYVPGRKDPTSQYPFAGNPVTQSVNRHSFRQYYYQKFPKNRLGGPTVEWVLKSVIATRRMRKESNLKKIKVPVIIFQAEKESLVDNEAQDEVCLYLNDCRLEKIEGAKHDLLSEKDIFRNKFISGVLDFFNSSKQKE